jgi:hypothetical protein
MMQDSPPTPISTKPKVSAFNLVAWTAVILSGLIVPLGIIAYVTSLANQQAWKPAAPTPEFEELVASHLNIGPSFTAEQALASASYRQIGDRFRIYQFDAPQTCGDWGCLNIVFDAHLQASKAFHLKESTSPDSDLSIGENGCLAVTRSTKNGLPQKFPLCLSQ